MAILRPKTFLIDNKRSFPNTWTSSLNIHHTPWGHIRHRSLDETSAVDNKPFD